jgi:hypothetical protein
LPRMKAGLDPILFFQSPSSTLIRAWTAAKPHRPAA